MARTEIPIVVLDASGTALPNASVRVKYRGSTDATVYQSETGPTTVTNPMLTDASGRVAGWVERDKYEAYIIATNLAPYTEYFEASPGGDGTIDTDWIADSAVTNAKIVASAGIPYSKLSLAGSILNADVNSAAAIAYSKLNLATSIVNADVSASAAIAYSKLNLGNSIANADVASGAAIAYSKLNLGTSIVNADVATAAAIVQSKMYGALFRGAGADISNIATEVDIFSESIAGGTMGTTRALRLVFGGLLAVNSGTCTITLRVKFGGSTLWGDASGTVTNSTTDRVITGDILLGNTSASAQVLTGRIRVGAAENGSVAGSGAEGSAFGEWHLHGTGTSNTGSSQTVAVSLQFSVANAANNLSSSYYMIDLV